MVTEDRAQLILVGAIAIGIVLIAMTTVLNSAVFTENVARSGSDEITGDVEEFDRNALRDVQSLSVRINHGTEYGIGGGEDELRGHLGSNVSDFSQVLAESYADTGSVYVNVTFDDATMGSRVVRDEDGDFSRNPGVGSPQATWTLLSDPFELGWFVVNVDVENVSQTDPSHVELTDTDGSVLNVSMNQTADGKLRVNSSIEGGNVSTVTCDPQNGRVLLDIVDGESYSGDCSFNSTEYLEPTYSELRIVHGDNARGKYDLVVNRSDPSAFVPGIPPCASPNDPCRGVAAWSMNFTTYYETGTLRHERSHRVGVYDG